MGRYTHESLTQFCIEHQFKLAKDYTDEHFTSELIITCECMEEGCTSTGSKTFSKLMKDKFIRCKPCSYRVRQIQTKATNLEKYGVENPMQSKEIQTKTEATNIKKYGVKHPAQNKEVMDKFRKTCQEKYQCDNPMQNQSIRKRQMDTMEEHYGVRTPQQSEEIKKKTQETIRAKYRNMETS